ncbi:MAG: hypothetical protein ACLQVL_36260 [Terriglobia bacterium]
MRKHVYLSTTLIVLSSLIASNCGTKAPVAPVPAAPVHNRILGVSPHSNPNYEMMKAGGIGWVRQRFAFPYEDKVGGKLSEKFLSDLEQAKKIRSLGLRIMGGAPGPGVMAYDEKDKKTAWRPRLPAWAGSVDSDTYYQTYEQACEELGRQTKGIVEMWQVANEMDIDVFRGPLSVEQAERFMIAGGQGLKKGNPDAKADINPAGLEVGERLFRDIYSRPDNPFDYAGIDGYFGSWAPGGPQDWIPVIEKIHAITGKPVLINEWGYSSIEGSGKPLHKKIGNPVCEKQKWNNVWGKGHTPEEQAAYVEIALKIFGTYPNVVGCFFYDWGDDAVCYHCGQTNCPAECGWGMTDPQGKPKPAYDVFKRLAPAYF